MKIAAQLRPTLTLLALLTVLTSVIYPLVVTGLAQVEDLPRVFDKFYRAQRPESVSGTGLAICKGIVETHGSTIQAANRPGGGTLISITLPLEDG